MAQLYRRGLLDASGRLRSAEEVAGRMPDSLAADLDADEKLSRQEATDAQEKEDLK